MERMFEGKKNVLYTVRFLEGEKETWNIYQGGSAPELHLARERNVPTLALSLFR
jgi:hypothetical protein